MLTNVPDQFLRAEQISKFPYEILYEETSPAKKTKLVPPLRSAIHSGKLGDLVYALPTCRALGIRHLYLNIFESSNDPLRTFPFSAARAIVPLLLNQPYLEKISIIRLLTSTDEMPSHTWEFDYNFDFFRHVARYRAGKIILTLKPDFAWYDSDNVPAHLGEIFAAALGVQADLKEPWLTVMPSQATKGRLVFSVTKNWRSYPDWYWKELIRGLPKLSFIGLKSEWERIVKAWGASFSSFDFIAAQDHLELASLIKGSGGFLGTVSFPYAIAEALKVPRAVEICHRNLNAFPIGENGLVLSPDIKKARSQINLLMSHMELGSYSLEKIQESVARITSLKLEMCVTRANESLFTFIRRKIIRLIKKVHSYQCNYLGFLKKNS